jgi:dihydrofolate reductase
MSRVSIESLFGDPEGRTTREVPVRQIRYVVTASLDGYIAGPNGEVDWIVPDPDFDFRALLNQFDTALLGRRSYEMTLRPGVPPWPPGMSVYVFSRTVQQHDHPKVTMVADKLEETLAALRAKSGKDIWLFGGGSLFRSVLDAGLVDTVEVAVRPVLLGGGIPLLPPPTQQANLRLTAHEVSKRGIAALRYTVE